MSKRNKKNRAIRDLGAESLGQDSADENSDTQNSYYQYLEHFIDEIYEKKAAARERGIEKLVEELQTHYSYDFVNQRRTVLLEIITRILKRGSSNEKTLACRLATVLTITLGVDALEVFQLLAPILQEHIRTLHESSVTSVYVDTLAMISFIACESESEIREIIELFGSVLTTDRQQLHADVIQSALNAWGLLLTVVDSKYLTQQLIPTYLKCIVNYLNDAELAVQISAGEDIALVTSLLNTLNSRDGNPEDANIESDNFSNDDNESQSIYKPPPFLSFCFPPSRYSTITSLLHHHTLALDFALHRAAEVVEKLTIYPERMRANLEALGGVIYSGEVLLALARAGLSREAAYAVVQRHAMATWEAIERGVPGPSFRERLAADPEVTAHLSPAALAEAFDLSRHLAAVDLIFTRVFGEAG
jgi:hypothetical protein